MAENRGEVLLGALVLALATGFGIYVSRSAGWSAGESGAYELTASFRSAEGVRVGTDIRLAGVKIGTVAALDLDPESYRARARLAITSALPLPDDSAAVISSEGLLGGNFVEVQPGGSPFNFEPGAEIIDTQGAVSLVDLLLKFVSGGGGEDEGASGATP